MADSSKCRQCHTDMHLETIGNMSGEDGALKVSMSGFPVMVCERGHKHFMAPDFPMKLLKHVATADEAKLPAGKKKGLVFKDYLCGKCGEKLGSESEAKPFGFDVKVDDFPEFRVEVHVPVYKCSACGCEQVRDREEVQAQTPAALAHSFQAAGLKPEA
jgi:DNA-directed RNA polymerase subunit RPC12/RpoP